MDNIKGILSCALQNISFMLPVGLLYLLVGEIMDGTLTTKRIPFYVTGCIAAALLIVVCTRLEYDNTYLVTYVESGVRRVNLAEKLRKIPFSFFGKKDLADLTSSIMNDCAVLKQKVHFLGLGNILRSNAAHRASPRFTPVSQEIGPDDRIGSALDGITDVVHVVGLPLFEVLEHIRKGTGRLQECLALLIG